MSFLFGETERADLKNQIATVRWTVAADSWMEANLNFCLWQKCKQIWAVPPNENPFSKEDGFFLAYLS